MKILRSTPILLVDQIESYLPFWRDRMGYQVVAEVPHEDRLGFVILSRDGQEVMLQTHASAAADLPEVGRRSAARGMAFFHEVDDLDEVLTRLEGVEILAGPRLSFYGMHEVFVADSEGVVHGYAQRAETSG